MSLLILALVVVSIFILWHFMPQTERKPPQPSPRFRLDPRVHSDEELWQSFVEEHCESPAEIAFLRAMIEAHAMRPEAGSLVANGLRLDFQVEEGRYRTDFLVNRWLVVEIDGAAYHSSPEAKARDQARDRYFEGLGYTVLRLPAKLVFQTPNEAVKAVNSALALGKREAPPPPAVTKVSWDKKRAVGQALAGAELVVSTEHTTLAAALDLARQRAEHASWLASLTEEGLAEYEQAVADIKVAVTDGHSESPSRAAHPQATKQRLFQTPSKTGDEWIDERVAEGFRLLTERRLANFQSVRTKLATDASIRPHMRLALADLGHEELWASVS